MRNFLRHSLNLVQNGVNVEMIEKATSLCRAYLPGAWKRITSGDIEVTRINGGLSNWLYHVKLRTANVETHPREVMLRLYGQSHADANMQLLIQESVVFALLSERKLGPRLYGVFSGGRIEEYIPARPLRLDELKDPKLTLLIAEKMAAIHSLSFPISKEPTWLWDTIYRWINTIGDFSLLEHDNVLLEKFLKKDIFTEIKWLKSHLCQLHSPVVFSHNDFNEGNILIRTDLKNKDNAISPSLVIIDYEYCAYNYRGFELANHFLEWIFNYKETEYPYYKVLKENYPSAEQQKLFIEHYLSKMRSEESVSRVMEEVKHFSLASHLFWFIWSLLYGKFSEIRFGYWEYAVERMQMYYALKSQILSNGKKCIVKR